MTPIRKVQNFVGELRVRKLLAKARKVQDDVGDSLAGDGSVLGNMFRSKTAAEKKKENLKYTLARRENKRAVEVAKEEERAFQEMRRQRLRR